ncbi:MAG: glycogen/starch synthase [Candidatus Omnitrophica bacterium]|nr:glycogen/starch synthase [Candidatus Omnitrophota bacterium]
MITNSTFALDIPIKDTLSPPLISQVTSLTSEFESSRQDKMMDMKQLSVMISIADHFLSGKGENNSRTLIKKLMEDFGWDSEFLKGLEIDLGEVKFLREKGVVHIPFEKNYEERTARIRKMNIEEKEDHDGWQIVNPYAIKIEKDESDLIISSDRDIKGLNAPPTEPIIVDLIKEGKVVEIYLDEKGELKGNKVHWTEEYKSVSMSSEEYNELWLGVEMDLRQLLSNEKIEKLKNYLKMDKYRIGGRPMRIKAVLSGAALGWKGKVSHSNFVHASVTSSSVYVGGALLEYMLENGNEDIWRRIIDNDELRHLRGLEHDEKEVAAVLEAIKPAAKKFETIKSAFDGKGDAAFLLKQLDRALDKKDNKDLFQFLSVCNKVCLGQELYPVERSYPLKKAFALLAKEKQEEFIRRVTSKEAKEKGYRGQIIVDDILLLVADVEMLKKEMGNWVEENAPELLGRSLWQISPEIWHEAGGLARVMQYHGKAILDLIGLSDVRLRHIEPKYKNRVSADGTLAPLDYTKDVTHPVQSLEEVKRKDGKDFEVTVGTKTVKFRVFKGTNSLGIESYMIEDVPESKGADSYYTHSLYNYKNEADPDSTPEVPTWEQFSVFISKASLEFVRYVENEERKEKESKGEKWLVPVMHTNDSQTALVGVYKRMLLDEEIEKHENDPRYEIDPVLEDGILFFTTHTYNNRKCYGIHDGYGDNVLNFMGIPQKPEYREMFRRWMDGDNYVYDMASGGVRFSDGHNGVAKMHRDEVAPFDTWSNSTTAGWLYKLFRKMGVFVKLLAISNADDRERTAMYFRGIMKELYGNDVDVEHPTPEQVYETKKEVKKRFFLENKIRTFYSTEDIVEGETLLNPDQVVISSSGRLVQEKSGRVRALSDENIKEQLKKGAQVVIFGNVQAKIQVSEDIKNGIIRLINEIKEEKKRGIHYPGRLIFVSRFSLKEQRMLLAATDLQICDSDPETEAAGYTEQDVSVCGGLVLAPYRPEQRANNEYGEGLFEAQGLPMRFEVPDPERANVLGNTVVPENASPGAYLKEIMKVIDKYDEGKLMYYQAESVRLSLVLSAYNTGAAYLRSINDTVARKQRRKDKRILERQIKKREQEECEILRHLEVLFAQEDPVKGLVCSISRKVLRGKKEEAIRKMFISETFQGRADKLSVIADVLNGLIDAYMEEKTQGENITSFIGLLKSDSFKLAGAGENRQDISRAIQVMAAQAFSILFWIETGYVESALDMWITTNKEEMVNNIHGDGKESYLSIRHPILEKIEDDLVLKKIENDLEKRSKTKRLFTEIKEAEGEGHPGYFWRGMEFIKKLGDNIFEGFIFNREVFENGKNDMVMYIMNHGIINVPYAMNKITSEGRISTIHDTFFVNDILPGSYQTTSTGAGHFQSKSLDIKQMTEGEAMQVSVLYDESGKIVEVVSYRVSKGDWFFALPGYVDYVVNLGGARFTDMSINVCAKDVIRLNPYVKELVKDSLRDQGYTEEIETVDISVLEEKLSEVLARMNDAVKVKAKHAPYVGARLKGDLTIINTMENTDLNSISLNRSKSYLNEVFGKKTLLLAAYKDFDEKEVSDIITQFTNAYREARTDAVNRREVCKATPLSEAIAIAQDDGTKNNGTELLKKHDGLYTFIDDTAEFVISKLSSAGQRDKLIRIPVEEIDFIGIESIRGFLEGLQNTEYGYIELFSVENPTKGFSEKDYKKYGLTKKLLPKRFKSSRANTVTVTPVFKGDQFATGGNTSTNDWGIGDMDPNDTIITPVGLNYDRGGILRSVFLGVCLSEIAEKEYKEENVFVAYTLLQIARLCFSSGIDPRDFDLTEQDLVNMAMAPVDSKKREWLDSFNKFLELLPIFPVDTEELRNVYEHARKALIRA